MRRLFRHVRDALLIALGAALVAPKAATACGPGLPNRILIASESEFLEAPYADFGFELRRLASGSAELPMKPFREPGSLKDETAAAELADLVAALQEQGLPDEQKRAIVAEHGKLRQALKDVSADAFSWRAEPGRVAAQTFTVPSGLPGEFDDYVRGAISYHGGDLPEARGRWQRLLERTAAERRHRSVWAAFMLGKSWLDADPAQAVTWFRTTRELAAAGCSDRLNLAAASIGWEARAEFGRKDYARAAELYVTQLKGGDPSAYHSLVFLSRALFAEDAALVERAAASPTARRVMTAYLLSQRKDAFVKRRPADSLIEAWLSAVERAKVPAVEGADRLAWLAYQQGLIDVAERWLSRAAPDSPIALWIKAKLSLRAGKVDAAAELLARASRLFPADETWSSIPVGDDGAGGFRTPGALAQAEFGVLKLARRQFTESLDALLRAGWWIDAAYVAERVLTLDELKRYVDRNWKEAPPPAWDFQGGVLASYGQIPDHQYQIRYLLARRFARAQRWKEAREYYPAQLVPSLKKYLTALAKGADAREPAEARAAALWEVATTERESGIELFGTEVEPDWWSFRGSFDLSNDSAKRQGEALGKLLRPSTAELARVREHTVTPDRRFHYRFHAADHAFEAARLMPKDSDQAALWLCTAGRWIMAHYPAEADRFYKALVRDHGGTELGREAERLRWFPPIPIKK